MQRISFKQNKRKLIFSLISAFLLIVANYFVNNMSFLTFESTAKYYCFQKICAYSKIKSPVNYVDAVYFNISYDKQFVPAYEGDYLDDPDDLDEAGFLGNNIVTDRKKLYEFLSLLKETNSYGYVILDIAFDNVRDKTEYDDSLFNTIKLMRNIVFADMQDVNLDRADLYYKRAKAFYHYTPLETNFARYRYTVNDTASIAAYAFNELNPKKEIKEHGYRPFNFYTSDGKLCYNSLFLTFDEYSISSRGNSTYVNESSFDEIEVFNLGQFMRENSDDLSETIKNTCKDKFVVICNTETDDMHYIYAGTIIPGGQIIIRALTSLNEGKHLVSFWITLYWFIIFFVICFCIVTKFPGGIKRPIKFAGKVRSFIYKIPLMDWIGRFICRTDKFWKFIISLISIAFLLGIFSFIEYVYWDSVTSVFLPCIFFLP